MILLFHAVTRFCQGSKFMFEHLSNQVSILTCTAKLLQLLEYRFKYWEQLLQKKLNAPRRAFTLAL